MRALTRPFVLAGLAVFLLIAGLTASDWQHQHDEGVTFDIAVGRIESYVWEKRGQALASWPVTKKAPEVYEALSGSQAPTWGEVIDHLREPQRMPHPPLFYLMLNSWVRVAGTDTVVIRVPAMILGLLTLLALWHLGNRLCGEQAGDWVVVMAAVSPWMIQVTCFLRPYSLVLCLSLWATLALLAAHDETSTDRRRLRMRIAFAVLSALGLYGVYHYVFVFAVHGVLLLWLARGAPAGARGRALGTAAATMAGAVLLYAPWLPIQLGHLQDLTESTYFFTTDEPWKILLNPVSRWLGRFTLAGEYTGQEYQLFRTVYAGLFLLTYPFTILSFLKERRGDLDRAGRGFWITIAALPLLIFGADLVRGTKTLFVTKYAFYLFPVFVLLAVRGLRAIPSRVAGAAVLGGWLAMLTAADLLPLATAESFPDHYDVAVSSVEAHDRPGHLIVLSSFDRRYGLPLMLNLRDAGLTEVSYVRARAAQLNELVRTLGASKRFRRVSLLNLDTTAEYETIITDQGLHMWPAADLQEAYRLAAVNNFEAKKRHVRGEKAHLLGQGNEKRMLVLEGIHHKTFHGPN